MQKEKKDKKKRFKIEIDPVWFYIITVGILLVGYIGFSITLLIMYGDKPIDEIPSWVLWFLWNKR